MMTEERRYMDYRQFCLLVSTVTSAALLTSDLLDFFVGKVAGSLQPSLSLLGMAIGAPVGFAIYRSTVKQWAR